MSITLKQAEWTKNATVYCTAKDCFHSSEVSIGDLIEKYGPDRPLYDIPFVCPNKHKGQFTVHLSTSSSVHWQRD